MCVLQSSIIQLDMIDLEKNMIVFIELDKLLCFIFFYGKFEDKDNLYFKLLLA